MDFSTGVALGGLFGLALGLLSEAIRRRWAKADDRQRRVDLRTEQAADSMLEVLDQLADLVSADADDSWSEERRLGAEMDRLAVRLGNGEIRRRFEAISDALGRTNAIAHTVGDRPQQIAWKVRQIGRNAIGHVLSAEPLGDAAVLGAYREGIEEYDGWQAEAESSRRAVNDPDVASVEAQPPQEIAGVEAEG